MTKNIWSVAVFRCDPSKAKEILVDLYDFAKDLEEVKDLHFIIRDRVKDEVVFSFRFMIKEDKRKILTGKIAFKLNSMLPKENFVIDPSSEHPFFNYETWSWKKTLKERGPDKFNAFCHFLSRLSFFVVEMAKQDYFSSSERVEMAHVMSWMLGCVEKTVLMPQKTVNSVLTGLYDRIDEKFYAYSKQDYPKIDS